MNKDEVKQKTEFLLDQLNEHMKAKISKAISSGALNIENYENNYFLPKIITYALMKEGLNQTKPLDESALKEANNLYQFI